MSRKSITGSPSSTDRMGKFIGRIRDYERITLAQLSHGLCSPGFLNRIENGEREVGKQLTDTLFQRLGKPVEMFERIINWDEFQQWKLRQKIISFLKRGEVDQARSSAIEYKKTSESVLDKQFLQIVEINCCALSGATTSTLLPMVRTALELTQPAFDILDIQSMLLSQNEGRLLFAYLQLLECEKGFQEVETSYHQFLQLFYKERYESRERVYLFPYIALRVIENEYSYGRYSSALKLCEEAIQELTAEKRLFAYVELLEWKQRLFVATGRSEESLARLIQSLKEILAYKQDCSELLVPCDERGNVYCINHVIRSRRTFLGMTQEELSSGICLPHTLSRIENCIGKLRRNNRRALLGKVNMSGERYDYEIITDSYEDYLMRSELDRATIRKDWNKVHVLLNELRLRTPNTPTNNQYFEKKEAGIRVDLSAAHPEKISRDEYMKCMYNALRLTIPRDLNSISSWPLCTLAINEVLCLMAIANEHKRNREYEKSLEILSYILDCLKNGDVDALCYVDLYTRVGVRLASVLNDLGRYHEAIRLAHECVELELSHGISNRLAQCFYSMVCNTLALAKEASGCIYEIKKKEAVSCLQLAYAASILNGDKIGQAHISRYGRETLGVTLDA